jgi:metallo-beta-lactamase family protein
LAIHATDVFRLHPECYDVEALDAAIAEKDHDPLSFPRLHYVRESVDSKKLTASAKPAVILSAAGMCESGRILHHLRAGLGNPHTTVLFVGYQAENTLGRKILSGQNPVPILGDLYDVRARVAKLEGCSAHADQAGLLDWAAKTRAAGQVERIFLVHGEQAPQQTLATLLRKQGSGEVTIPRRGQRFEL